MKALTFKTTINAPKQKVWDTMTGAATYAAWTGAAWPGSHFEGEWKSGNSIRFTGPDGSGTLATITTLQPYDLIAAEHIAILLKGGAEDRESEMACGWTGSKERYDFSERDGKTELKVTMTVGADWEDMFNKDWPKALAKLKEICEQ